jgi:hypothetical protein
MDAKKIMKLSEKVLECDAIIDMLNSDVGVIVSFDNGAKKASLVLTVSAQDKSTYKISGVLSNLLQEYRAELERDILHYARPGK